MLVRNDILTNSAANSYVTVPAKGKLASNCISIKCYNIININFNKNQDYLFLTELEYDENKF